MPGRHSWPLIPLLLLADLLAITGAWLLAFSLRFYTPLLDLLAGPAQNPPPLLAYLSAIPIILLVTTAAFSHTGFYKDSSLLAKNLLGPRLLATLLALTVLLALSALYRGASYSRLVILLFLLLAPLLANLARSLTNSLFQAIYQHGSITPRHALIIGQGALADKLTKELEKRPWYGLKAVASLSPDTCLQNPQSLLDACQQQDIKELFIAVSITEAKLWPDLEQLLRSQALDLHIVIDGEAFLTLRPRSSMLGALPILTLRESPGYGLNRFTKRLFDLSFATLFLILSLPLLTLLAILIKLSSRGPVFYTQQRVGWGGARFTMIKFRTMRTDAEAQGPQFATHNDPRRTLLGAFLRRSSLDELPQLLNVLRGDMSLVGPRPERPEFLGQISQQLPHFPLRQSVKAGMTGLAQINGQRGQAPLADRLHFDLEYVQNWSLWLDLKILILTICGGFLSKNAI